MLQRVQSSNRAFEPEGFETLLLDGILVPIIMPQDKQFILKLVNLRMLALNACGMRSLLNFPIELKLVRLELCDNKLANIQFLKHFYILEVLKLQSNELSTVESLIYLGDLKSLRSLYLAGNPVCDLLLHTEKVFKILPYLENLDGISRDGEDCMTDDYD